MFPYGASARSAAAWSISSLPQPLMAVPAFIAVRTFEPLLPAGVGFAAGAMVLMVFTQLLRESLAVGSRRLAVPVLLCSAALMTTIEVLIGF